MWDEAADREALIAEITAAFDGVARGDGVTIHEAQVLDRYDGAEERARARLLDPETRWQDVPDEKIETYQPFAFLDAEGFRFYLPAYLLWMLRYLDDASSSGSMSYESTIFTLGYRPTAEDTRFALLDGVQRRAVCRFLCHLLRGYPEGTFPDIENALARGWGDYYSDSD